MKSMKLLLLTVFSVLVPMASSALDLLCGLPLLPPCETTAPPAVPEPSGALIMGAALLVLAAARRKSRN